MSVAAGTVGVHALDGRDAVGERFSRPAAVGGGPGHLAPGDVGGHGIETRRPVIAARTDARSHLVGDHLRHPLGDLVGIVEVVAVVRDLLHDALAKQFVPFPVGHEGIVELAGGAELLVEDHVLDGHQTVDRGADAHAREARCRCTWRRPHMTSLPLSMQPSMVAETMGRGMWWRATYSRTLVKATCQSMKYSICRLVASSTSSKLFIS